MLYWKFTIFLPVTKNIKDISLRQAYSNRVNMKTSLQLI